MNRQPRKRKEPEVRDNRSAMRDLDAAMARAETILKRLDQMLTRIEPKIDELRERPPVVNGTTRA